MTQPSYFIHPSLTKHKQVCVHPHCLARLVEEGVVLRSQNQHSKNLLIWRWEPFFQIWQEEGWMVVRIRSCQLAVGGSF